jgi:peptidoglycan hydrolase FlgJ
MMGDALSRVSPASMPPGPDAKARKAAREFEAVFIGQMTKLMLDSIEQDEGFSGGHGEAMFRGVLAEQMGAQIARGRGIGIAQSVMAEIIRLQQGQKQGG